LRGKKHGGSEDEQLVAKKRKRVVRVSNGGANEYPGGVSPQLNNMKRKSSQPLKEPVTHEREG